MSLCEALYRNLPTLAQHLACSAEGWRIRRTRYNEGFASLLEKLEARSKWSSNEIAAFRDGALRKFVLHSAATVPYYRELFRSLGIDPTSIRSLADLASLPITPRSVVQERTGDFFSDALEPSQSTTAHTSGTTGAGLRFRITAEAQRRQWATWWRYRRWHGIELDCWSAHFGGRSVVPVEATRSPFWRHNVPGKQILFSGYHLSERNLEFYVDELRRRRPLWIHGYPSLLALVASWLSGKGADLGYEVRWVTTGAENLLPSQKEIIRRGFGVRPRQHYGMAEGVANFSECTEGNLHVDEDFSATEFLPTEDGAGYRVVGTNFSNAATALLRYETNDVVSLRPGPCSCGLPGRIIESVDGRQEDYVILPGGARVGRLDHIFKDLINIREAQLVQRSLDSVTIRVSAGPCYSSEDERKLLDEAHARLGHTMLIAVERVESIPRPRGAKLRLVMSELNSGRLE